MNSKPLGSKSYGSIAHLKGSRMGEGEHTITPGQQQIATERPRDKKDLVICQEKLDGSNCSIAKIEGKIYPLTRAGYLASTSPYVQHQYFAQWVQSRDNLNRFERLLHDGERVCGEWLLQAHGTRYALAHEPFVPFDLMHGKTRMTYHNFLLRVLPFKFTVPRLLHIGQPFSIKDALREIKTSGHRALDEVEGAVWRVEREERVDFLCKYVRPTKQDGIYLPEISGGEAWWNIPLSIFNEQLNTIQ